MPNMYYGQFYHDEIGRQVGLGLTTEEYVNAGRVYASGGADVNADYAIAKDLFSRWFGGDARDAARNERAAWLTSLATAGNIAAAQCILGGQGEISGGEAARYIKAEQLVRTNGGGGTMDLAAQRGPYWSNEGVETGYPKMRAFVQQGGGVTGALLGGDVAGAAAGFASSSIGGIPLPLLIGGALAAVLIMRKR